ncbi:MAG: hypothetical protein AUG80_14945 [Candidatus Rokubacteria bacterium 13_1_20CM_4_68_9]|nr:MAG: hypothetical protein AUG80_14945 [Candidatus Rokubacteria bacterium 13_1_20CM_4_68_9]
MAMTGRTSRRYGGDVDEGAVALIRFPDERLAHFHSSFGEEPRSAFTIFGEEGSIHVLNAFTPTLPSHLVTVKRGERQEQTFEPTDEYAAVLAYFADAIREDRQPEPSGIEGLQDTRLIEAIYRSSRDGRPVTLPRLARVEPSPVDNDVRRASIEGRQAG